MPSPKNKPTRLAIGPDRRAAADKDCAATPAPGLGGAALDVDAAAGTNHAERPPNSRRAADAATQTNGVAAGLSEPPAPACPSNPSHTDTRVFNPDAPTADPETAAAGRVITGATTAEPDPAAGAATITGALSAALSPAAPPPPFPAIGDGVSAPLTDATTAPSGGTVRTDGSTPATADAPRPCGTIGVTIGDTVAAGDRPTKSCDAAETDCSAGVCGPAPTGPRRWEPPAIRPASVGGEPSTPAEPDPAAPRHPEPPRVRTGAADEDPDVVPEGSDDADRPPPAAPADPSVSADASGNHTAEPTPNAMASAPNRPTEPARPKTDSPRPSPRSADEQDTKTSTNEAKH